MQNPLESEEVAFRFVLGAIVYFVPIVVAAWIATWLGVIVFVGMSVLAFMALRRGTVSPPAVVSTERAAVDDTPPGMTTWLDDPAAVAEEYASEDALRQRVLAHRELVVGPDDEEIVRERILEARPRRLLEVGSGLGELCGWARSHLDGDVVAVDSSQRMVELAREAGVTGVLADMRALPFPDGSFDCAVANFVLYHVADPETAIAELARVLEPGGWLIASTLSDDTSERRLAWARLFDEEPQPPPPPLSFSRENGRQLLLERFHHVEQRDCDAELVFPTRDRLARYVASIPPMSDLGSRVPDLVGPFHLPQKTTVFHARTPR